MTISRIEKLEEEIAAKRKLIGEIKEKRKVEIGALAIKAKLDKFDDKVLLEEFQKMAEKLGG